jgi:ABC-type antimicrobial peptide transport system permease subunit
MWHNIRSAWSSIWNNKARSILTVLGVVIGVTSVTTLVSLGQGLKNDVSKLIQGLGTNVIAITGGKLDTQTTGAQSTNPANFISGDILTLHDVEALSKNPDLESVSPMGLVSGNLKYQDKTATPTVIGAYPNFTHALQVIAIDKGKMFDSKAAGRVIVLGDTARQALFDGSNPIGKKITLAKQEFEVIGTFGKVKNAGVFGSDTDAMAVIPFETATELNKDQPKIARIIAKARDTADITAVKKAVKETMLDNHDGEEDFTVLTQDDILDLFDTFLTLATTMVSAIAAISLVVGGIGIMNIMLVTVTERTREIGLRKAVGATKGAILTQFLTEAIVITLVGSLIGLAISFAVGATVAAMTDLQPAITPSIIMIAVGIAVGIGVIFGLWPALRAAQKDPIEALRYE